MEHKLEYVSITVYDRGMERKVRLEEEIKVRWQSLHGYHYTTLF